MSVNITRGYAAVMGIPLVAIKFYPVPVIEAVLLSFLGCLVGGFLPAWGSSRTAPARAMRQDIA